MTILDPKRCANTFWCLAMYASGFLQATEFIYRTIIKCHQVVLKLITSLLNCRVKPVTYSNFDQWLLLLTLFITFLSTVDISMASPLRSPKISPSSSRRLSLNSPSPKWINPCRLQTHPINPDKEFAGAPPVSTEELFHNVMSRAKVARNHGQQIKRVFLNNTLNDPEFEDGVKTYRQEWLPQIPPTSEEVFKQITPEQAFKMAFEFTQYFAVGLEQILLDQVLHDGKMTSDFQEVEHDLFQLLCEIQLGMHLLNIEPKPDVLRNVMSHQYRDIGETSLRNLRDYLILRDYIAATNFTAQLFAYNKSKVANLD